MNPILHKHFCECKYRNKSFGIGVCKDFMDATEIHTKPVDCFYYIFNKSGFTEAVIAQTHHNGVLLVGLDDLFLAV